MDMAIGGIGTYSNNEYDVTVAKASTDGTWQWAQTLVGNGNERHSGVAIDAEGMVYLSGWYENGLVMGSQNLSLGWNGTDTGLWSDSHGFVALSDAGGDWIAAVSSRRGYRGYLSGYRREAARPRWRWILLAEAGRGHRRRQRRSIRLAGLVPSGETGWTSNPLNDYDSDGCKDDSDEDDDADDDNDGVTDGIDSCPRRYRLDIGTIQRHGLRWLP